MHLQIFVLLFLFLNANSFAQEIITDTSKKKINKAVIYYGEKKVVEEVARDSVNTVKKAGSLSILQEDSLDLLIEGYKEQKKIEGYKIQIFSGKSKMDAIKAKSSFHSKYGESEIAEIVYQQPNFKIRVGNYRDRLQANKWLEIYKLDFPSSFIVKDAIKIILDN